MDLFKNIPQSRFKKIFTKVDLFRNIHQSGSLKIFTNVDLFKKIFTKEGFLNEYPLTCIFLNIHQRGLYKNIHQRGLYKNIVKIYISFKNSPMAIFIKIFFFNSHFFLNFY